MAWVAVFELFCDVGGCGLEGDHPGGCGAYGCMVYVQGLIRQYPLESDMNRERERERERERRGGGQITDNSGQLRPELYWIHKGITQINISSAAIQFRLTLLSSLEAVPLQEGPKNPSCPLEGVSSLSYARICSHLRFSVHIATVVL